MSAIAEAVFWPAAMVWVDSAVYVCCSTEVNCASSVTNCIGSLEFGFIGFWFLSSAISICRNWFWLIGMLFWAAVAAVVPVAPVVAVVLWVVKLIEVVLVSLRFRLRRARSRGRRRAAPRSWTRLALRRSRRS